MEDGFGEVHKDGAFHRKAAEPVPSGLPHVARPSTRAELEDFVEVDYKIYATT